MIREIIARSLKFRVLVIAVALVVMIIGTTQLRDAPVDLYPEFTPTQVQIQTEALGLSAAEVEQLITVPLEKDLLNGIAWLSQIRSDSQPGLSSINLIFEPGTDLLKARQVVQERLSQGHALPNFGSPPVMIQPVSSTSRVMMIGLSSKTVSLVDVSVLARWKIKPRLLGIPGVANVSIWGQRDRQLQVQVDPTRLRQSGVALTQIINTAGNALWVSPLTFVQASTPGTGGFIDTSTQRFDIQHILPITTAQDLSNVALEGTQTTRRLGDVADVVEGHQPLIGDAVLSQGSGVVLVIQKFPEANTRSVTRDVEQALDALRPGLSGVVIDSHAYQAQTFIDTAQRSIGALGLAGLALLIMLLALVLFSWRRAFIAVVSILLSMIAASYVLFLLGATFNLLAIAGLAIALGVVIDDVVVTLGSIQRHLRVDQYSGENVSASAMVAEAVAAVRGPLVYATLVLLLVAVPLLLLDGVTGSFARPAATSYILAVLTSTVVAMTVTPVLAFILLRNERSGPRTSPPVRWASQLFDRVFSRYLRRPRWAYATLGLLLLMGLTAVPQLGSRTLIAPPQDRNLLIRWDAAPGTSLPEMTRITSAVSRDLRGVSGVQDVTAHLGRALTSDQIVNVNSGELWLRLADSTDYSAAVTGVGSVLHRYPGVRSDILTYAQERVAAMQTGTSPVVVRVYGQDLDVLRSTAQDLRRLIAAVPGVVQPKVQTLAEEPTLQVQVDLAAAQRYGLNPGDVRRTEATYFAGLPVGNLYQEQKIFDVVVVGSPNTRYTPSNVRDLLIDAPVGGQVRLGDIASVHVAPYPTIIRHDATSRSLDVTADVSGRDLASVLRDVRSRVASASMPLEYHAEVVSDTDQSQDLRNAGLAIGIALSIFLLLHAALGSWRLAALAVVVLPLAASGAAVAALAAGGLVSLAAVIGVVLVLGITARNTILLLSTYQRLESAGQRLQGPELVRRGTRERFGQTLLTAGALFVVLLPFALWGGAPGNEVLHTVAAVVLGGLVTSTVVTLLVTPVLYLRLTPPPPLALRGVRQGPATPATRRTQVASGLIPGGH